MEISELLKFVEDEKVTNQQIENAMDDVHNASMDDLVVASNLSVENTMVEINNISKRLYQLHNKNKRDPMVLTRILALLELKTKLLGMSNVKVDVQNAIDSEINIYKRRFIEVMHNVLSIENRTDLAEEITRALSKEGL